jgi:hypothetical protein
MANTIAAQVVGIQNACKYVLKPTAMAINMALSIASLFACEKHKQIFLSICLLAQITLQRRFYCAAML